MKFETPLLPVKNREEIYPVDDPWYERFRDAAAFQDYELLEGEKGQREEQKRAFLAGEIENPALGYPRLETFTSDKREKILLDLKKTIVENETNDVLKKAYAWKLNEKIAEVRMLKAAKVGDDRRFLRYSKFIYGEPDKDIYQYTISQLKNVVDKKIFDGNPKINQAAQRLNRELFETLMNNETAIDPKQAGFPEIKSTKEDKKYDASEIREAFESALRQYQLEGWRIIVDQKSSIQAISTSQEAKMVLIPEKREMKETRLKSLIEHEIGTHVLRRERGEKSKLKLLGLGLDRYLPGEEGIATYREQKNEGDRNFSGFEGHLAISLAMGLDGNKRNFRQVFEIMRDYFFINSSEKDTAKAGKNAEDSAWNRCVRTFRGTTCSAPGACFTRDIVYREGNIGIWDLIKSNPDEEQKFSIGKYDPTNFRHLWILERLGINENDLDKLEK